MTEKEKAQQLVHRFYFSLPNNGGFTGPCNINDRWEEGKKCALIAVDEIIKEYGTYYKVEVDGKYMSYWQQVKQEIEKL
jgi:hypothetical protein